MAQSGILFSHPLKKRIYLSLIYRQWETERGRGWAGRAFRSEDRGFLRQTEATHPNLTNGQTSNRNKVDCMFVHYMDKIPEGYAFCLCVLNVGLLLVFPTFNGDMDIKIFLNCKKSPEQA